MGSGVLPVGRLVWRRPRALAPPTPGRPRGDRAASTANAICRRKSSPICGPARRVLPRSPSRAPVSSPASGPRRARVRPIRPCRTSSRRLRTSFGRGRGARPSWLPIHPLDAPHYPLLIDPKVRGFYERQDGRSTSGYRAASSSDNIVTAAIPDVTFGFHLCRGNQASRWLVSGSYERIAKRIFQGVTATRLLLEYDDERVRRFPALAPRPR